MIWTRFWVCLKAMNFQLKIQNMYTVIPTGVRNANHGIQRLLRHYLSSWYFKSAKLRISKHLTWLASNITGGAKPASLASNQRDAHKHQRSPATKPSKPYSGLGVVKSFPFEYEKAKNSSVTCVHTVWLPVSSTPVSQQPVRVKPVRGSKLHTCKVVPNTLRAILFPKIFNFNYHT